MGNFVSGLAARSASRLVIAAFMFITRQGRARVKRKQRDRGAAPKAVAQPCGLTSIADCLPFGATAMQFVSAALILLLGCPVAAIAVAAAVTATGRPATRHAATPAPARDVYAAMTDAERVAIQSDLIWTGDYNGMVGPEFGDRAIVAVRAYQKRNGGKETGILNPDERVKLAQA